MASADRLIEQSHQAIVRIRARIQQTDGRVQRTFHRVRDAASAAQAAQRSANLADQRHLRAKQRELAAHERAIKRHDEAAQLQERFGHPDRATSAREHARQVRKPHEQALRELHDWAGPAPAGED